jgi:hypothetical protein
MFTRKMHRLRVTDEAKVFYLSNCLMQGDSIEAQQVNGVDPPKVRVDYAYAQQYYRINGLAQGDIHSMIEELTEAGVIDESHLN